MTDGCFFCGKDNFAERLVGETAHFYIIATLGQILQGGYLLLVPKRHVPCLGAMEEDEIKLFCAVKDKVYRALGYINEGSGHTIFEHGIAGQSIFHAHLHIIPVRAEFSEKVRADFIWNNIVTMPVMQNSWFEIARGFKAANQPYLLWKDASLGIKVCWDPKNVPQQYFRRLLFEAIGQQEIANWKTVDPEEDKKRWSATVKKLKPYFSSK